MRDFFVNLYKELKTITGIRQYEEIANSGKSKEQAQADFDALVNGCLNVCGLYFKHIPDDAKQRIIKTELLSDVDFYGLFPKTIHKYLSRHSDRFYLESHHIETNEIEYKEPEPLSPETQKMIDEWMEGLRKNAMSYQLEQHELRNTMKQIQREDEMKVSPKSVSTGYKLDREKAIEIMLKQQWMKETYDPIKQGPGIEFEEWLETLK